MLRFEQLEGRQVLSSIGLQVSAIPLTAAPNTSESTNWSGYVVPASAGAVSAVSGSWNVPTIKNPGKTTAYVAAWVGMDGFSTTAVPNNGTVEQTGTLSYVSGKTVTNYAWVEMYPGPMEEIVEQTPRGGYTPAPVKAGDVINASVTYGSSGFTVAIADKTQRWSFSGLLQIPAHWKPRRSGSWKRLPRPQASCRWRSSRL